MEWLVVHSLDIQGVVHQTCSCDGLKKRLKEKEKEREIPLWRYFGSDFVVIGGDLFYRHLLFAWRLLYSLNFTCSWVECKSESWSLPRLVPVLDVRHSPVRWFDFYTLPATFLQLFSWPFISQVSTPYPLHMWFSKIDTCLLLDYSSFAAFRCLLLFFFSVVLVVVVGDDVAFAVVARLTLSHLTHRSICVDCLHPLQGLCDLTLGVNVFLCLQPTLAQQSPQFLTITLLLPRLQWYLWFLPN